MCVVIEHCIYLPFYLPYLAIVADIVHFKYDGR